MSRCRAEGDRTAWAAARGLGLWSIALAAWAMQGGCKPEEKIIRYNQALANLPGAQTGTPPVRRFDGYKDPTAVEGNRIVLEDKDGHKTLIARSAQHLMRHIAMTLDAGERRLFVDQVLSEHTKRQYNVRGQPAEDAFDTLVTHRQDVQDLFDAMPMAELTPGLVVTRPDVGVTRLQVVGSRAEGLRWTAMDTIIERGNVRLVWFGNPPAPR